MNLNYLVVKTSIPPSNLFNHQIVRWLRPRKPFWLGIAKSKMFKVPEHKKVFETEAELKMFNNLKESHKMYLNTLLHFIKHDNPGLKDSELSKDDSRAADLQEKAAESFNRNDSWNAECARRREERLNEATRLKVETAIKIISEFEENKKKTMEVIEEIVRKEKKISESYITPENLDEEIEKCLSNVECFDFAIDLDGNIYPGRETLQVPISQESKAS